MWIARHARFLDSRARHARHDSNTGARGAKRAHMRAKKRFACIPTMRAFVARASSSGHRQGSPNNCPVSDPCMAHLP